MVDGMARVRISTTIDEARLDEARRLLAEPDSRLIDRALSALVDKLRAEQEQAALDAQPYESDPDLAWQAPLGPDLAYAGEVPADVAALAAERRGK